MIEFLLNHTSDITEAGNWIAVLGSAMGISSAIVWLKRNHLSDISWVFVAAFAGVLSYIFIHRAFWGLGLKFAEDGESYGVWFETWKAFMTFPISVILLASIVMVISAPEELKVPKKLVMFFGVIISAIVLTIL